jgi:hypothetical protein
MHECAEDQEKPGSKTQTALDSVKAALSTLRFGAIQLTIHEGCIVQLDVTERHRFPL